MSLPWHRSKATVTYTHSAEYNSKVVLVVVVYPLIGGLYEASLPADLRGNVVVRQTRSREDGDLLSARNTVHHVDSRDSRLNHLLMGVGELENRGTGQCLNFYPGMHNQGTFYFLK